MHKEGNTVSHSSSSEPEATIFHDDGSGPDHTPTEEEEVEYALLRERSIAELDEHS